MKCGEVIDHTYQLVREIGEGGAGIVYLAYHLRLEKYVVIKKLKSSPRNPAKTRKEVDILKSLHHKYLPQVYDYLEMGNEIYTIIDFIDGYDLSQYPKQGCVVSEEQAIKWLFQLADVLKYLHEHGIIHGDIKPSNIMVTPEDDICLIDFNISFDAESIDFSGLTPAYAPPEQIALANYVSHSSGFTGYRAGSEIHVTTMEGLTGYIDYRADFYSLGATFYHLMTGVRPYVGVLQDTPIINYQAEYRKGLLQLIEKMMDPDPERRFQSADQLLKAVQKITDEYKTKFRIRVVLIAGAAAMILLIAVGILVYRSKAKSDARQAYTAAYNQSVSDFNSGNYNSDEFRLNLLEEFLNNDERKEFLEDTPEQLAEVNYMVGYTYFLDGDYDKAVEHYETALKSNERNADLYRELAVCAARKGDAQKAEEYLSKASSHGMPDSDRMLINMELLLNQKQYGAVLDQAETWVASGIEAKKILRGAEICLEACEAEKGYHRFLSIFRSLYEKMDANESIALIRMLLRACGEEANSSEDPKQYLDEGEGYIRLLISTQKLRTEDRVIAADIYIKQGEYGEALSVLEAAENAEENYEVLLWEAYALRQRDGHMTRESRELKEKALATGSYKQAQASGSVDKNAERLIELLQN